MNSLVSIHDVMPSTLERVDRILRVFGESKIAHTTLLVVPGLDWQDLELDQLRKWQDKGYSLAGHGWVHRCETVRGIYHRLHSALLSRRVAEHLCLSPAERVALIQRCYRWFKSHHLDSPSLYVPPAWALGRLPQGCHDELPFRYCETLGGLWDWSTQRYQPLPVVGFEADTLFRKVSLRFLNFTNRCTSALWRRPLRISLHPFDLELLLKKDIRPLLEQVESIPYPS